MQEWLETGQRWLDSISDNVYLRALSLIVIFVVLAKITEWITGRLVTTLTRRTKTVLDDRIIGMLHRPVFVSVILIGLALATSQLQLDDLPRRVTLGALKSIAIVIWLVFSIRFTRLVLEVLAHYQDRFALVQARTLPIFDNLALLSLIGGAAYLLLMAWDLDPTGWLASAGIIGLALSFAARDSLANIFAGVFILADAPYKIGDFVILGTGERGRVTQIGLRSTRLLTRDDIEITIPNAVMGNSKIINESGGPHEKERIRVPIAVAYGSDIDQVREILLSHARADA